MIFISIITFALAHCVHIILNQEDTPEVNGTRLTTKMQL